MCFIMQGKGAVLGRGEVGKQLFNIILQIVKIYCKIDITVFCDNTQVARRIIYYLYKYNT